MRWRHLLLSLLLVAGEHAHAQNINDVQLRPGSSSLWGAAYNVNNNQDISQYNTAGSVVDSFRWHQGASPGSALQLWSIGPTGHIAGAATGGRQGAGTINAQGLFVNGAPVTVGGTPPGGSSGQVQYNNAGVFGGFTASGDATINTGSGALTLATVNANVGTFGSATSCVTTTVNAKGLTTAISAATCAPALGSITGFGTGVATALAINVGSAGAPVLFNGAGGTPSSMTGTNITGLNATNISGGTLNSARLAWNGTVFSANPAAPTGTTSGSFVMMGLGSTCTITPAFSSRIYVSIFGRMANSSAGGNAAVAFRFGTGAAPANGAADTGTAVNGGTQGFRSVAAADPTPIALSGVITGRTPGVAVWFDAALVTGGVGTATILTLACFAYEI